MFEPERRDLAHVPRWGIVRTIHRQSVAEHLYFVVVYSDYIAVRIGWPRESRDDELDTYAGRLNLLEYTAHHDDDEVLTGDIPGPVKRKCGMDTEKIKDLVHERMGVVDDPDPGMLAIRKAADLMDECMYLAGEISMGNNAVRSSLDNALDRLTKAVRRLPTEGSLINELIGEMRKAIEEQKVYTKDYRGFAGV